MERFGRFYLDKEKDVIVELMREGDALTYVLRTPNHGTGNLITNLAALCELPLSYDARGMKEIRGEVPCYIDGEGNRVYILRLRDTKVANIYPDGRIERKASIPAISKTLMSQTKEVPLSFTQALVKTWIPEEVKFRTDLHTHMNANLAPDVLIALGAVHQIAYPLYYVKKLRLRLTPEQAQTVAERRRKTAEQFEGSALTGKYLDRRIDDATFINFADLILADPENTAVNLPRIRASLSVLKDGQAVFTNLEKVYLYRYVFTKGRASSDPIPLTESALRAIPDPQIAQAALGMLRDRQNEAYAHNTLFQDKLLWIARAYQRQGVRYVEISDTTLVKPEAAGEMLRQVHAVMPAIYKETGVVLRFLAAIRRIPLTIVRDQVAAADYARENLHALRAVAPDPYVAGSDLVGEEINDIRDLAPVIREIVQIAGENPGFVIRVHAGENDSLRDNVAHSLQCVRDALAPGQAMPAVRIGHGLYTASLRSAKGRQLIAQIVEMGAVLEFQLTSNVRLNNLGSLRGHPLKQYLSAGVACVQGTDGGALYGTDTIDEELALRRLLDLSLEELLQMRAAEERVMRAGIANFTDKRERLMAQVGDRDPLDWIEERLREPVSQTESAGAGDGKLDSATALFDLIQPLPEQGVPLVLVGGSYNSDRRRTRVRPSDLRLIDAILEGADEKGVFLVVGHRLTGQEQALVKRARGRFAVYAFVPARLTPAEVHRLRRSGCRVRVSIESAAMGVYKSVAYEVFKHRPSVLVAFDGNSAGCNVIQEAKNAKYEGRIYVCRHSKLLYEKARSLEGYVTLFEGEEVAPRILRDLRALPPVVPPPGRSG